MEQLPLPEKEIQKLLKRYDDKRSALLPILHLLQERHGHLPDGLIDELAIYLEIQPIYIEELISYYPNFYKKLPGDNILQVCTHLTCSLFGGNEIYRDLHKYFKMEEGDVSNNGKLSFQKVECLGHCEIAPCVKLSHEKLCSSKVTLKEVIDKLEALP
jgi:NADH-quinone oxidoreductase subunit E